MESGHIYTAAWERETFARTNGRASHHQTLPPPIHSLIILQTYIHCRGGERETFVRTNGRAWHHQTLPVGLVCSGYETGSYLRLIYFCMNQL